MHAEFRPDRSIPFVDAVYRVIDGSGSMANVSILLCELEEKHRVFLRPTTGVRPLLPDAESVRWIEEHLFPFLDETHLVIAGSELGNDVDVCDERDRDLGATWRGWGRILADWANRRSWPPNYPAYIWTYMDFHLGGPPMLGYDEFVRVVLQAIHLP